MNKTDIEWADMTWNPVTGCRHNCEYCYARRIAARFGGYDKSDGTITTDNPLPRAELHQPLKITRRNGKIVDSPFPFGFEPTLHRYRLEEPQHRKKPQTIFVCSMADLFGRWVPDEWIEEVFDVCRKVPQHTYLFLTKNPERYLKLARDGMLPKGKNFWYGSTITGPDVQFFYSTDEDGAAYNTFLSIEPLIEPLGEIKDQKGFPRWVIIGAMTGPGSKNHQPDREWVEHIIAAARERGVPVFMKDSLIPVIGKENMRRDFPWERGAK